MTALSRSRSRPSLISDEPTVELILRARRGDSEAVEAILQRCLPSLRRWAHGRLPQSARGLIDTADLVQEAVLRVIQQLDTFEPRRVGAMQAYLRRAVVNRIIDEVRRVARHPSPIPLDDDHPATEASPLDVAIESDTYLRYRKAMLRLTPRRRQLVIARVEMRWSFGRIATQFGFPSTNAANVAVHRALHALKKQMRDS